METDQEKLRALVRRRCTPQKEVAKQIGVTNIYLNHWIKGHRDCGPDMVKSINEFLVN
jgi:DNA-binding transcriptional regulator YdaS (Cro superfamily)